ncbi:hypothetical protein BDV98DRAFT_577923 [Pterulicium gracile]|uniref:Uncharacterized protein n=1 Tax=Pterulicium gracile TaxID=1884261 RepID=A0A5C3Q2P0_9AGAR|nr:hypothetical protein BDV98DRAFT_577923 [Pterula gracilis]
MVMQRRPQGGSSTAWWDPLDKKHFVIETSNRDTDNFDPVGRLAYGYFLSELLMDCRILADRAATYLERNIGNKQDSLFYQHLRHLAGRLDYSSDIMVTTDSTLDNATVALSRLQHQYHELRSFLDYMENVKPRWDDLGKTLVTPHKSHKMSWG